MALGGPESTPFLVFPGARHFGVLMANLMYFVNVYVCCCLFYYFFMFGCAGSLLLLELFPVALSRDTPGCSVRASLCEASRCRALAPGSRASVAVAQTRELLLADSEVVVVHGLSCSTACGIFLDQGLNLCPLH